MDYQTEFVSLHAEPRVGVDVRLRGQVKVPVMRAELFAAAPATRGASFAGSGLPFPSAELAFSGSPNHFEIDNSGQFDVTFLYPNAYHTPDGALVPPAVFAALAFDEEDVRFVKFDLPRPEALKARSLTFREGHRMQGAAWYYQPRAELGVPPSQEDLLKTVAALKQGARAV